VIEFEKKIENSKSPKSPLANGTNRQPPSLPPPPVKPRLRPTSSTTCPPSPRSSHKVDLEKLTRCSLTPQYILPNAADEKWLALAASDDHVLVGGGSSSSLRLFDLRGKEKHIIDIKTFAAFDLAWSSVLNAFLIAGYDRLQMYNVEHNELSVIEQVHLTNKKQDYFWSIACHENDLFVVLSDGLESIWRLSLPTFKRRQILSGSEVRESDADDRISCIRTNGVSIGMTLRQRNTYQWRVDLFDYVTMKRTHRGLTIGYGTGAFNFIERCMLAPVGDYQWLIIGGHNVQPNALTLMDERTGELKQVERQHDRQQEVISNICAFGKNKNVQPTISMIVMDNNSGQRQMHVVQQQE